MLIIIWKLPSRSQEKNGENEHQTSWELYCPNTGLADLHFVEMKRGNPIENWRVLNLLNNDNIYHNMLIVPVKSDYVKLLHLYLALLQLRMVQWIPKMMSFWFWSSLNVTYCLHRVESWCIPKEIFKKGTPITSAKCNQYLKSIPKNSPTDAIIPLALHINPPEIVNRHVDVICHFAVYLSCRVEWKIVFMSCRMEIKCQSWMAK